MLSVRSTLLAAAAGVAMTVGSTVPAYASVAHMDAATCADARASRDAAATAEQGTRGRLSAAQSALNAARAQLGNDQSQDSVEDAITPDTSGSDPLDDTIVLDQLRVNSRVADVNTAQANENTALAALNAAEAAMNTACNTVTVPSPTPTPTPPSALNCAQILASTGRQNIPIGDSLYRSYLDVNQDGIACETTIPVGTVRTVHGKKCHWNGTAWIPMTTVVTDPCNCTPTPTPTPTPAPATVVVTQPAPATPVVVQSPPQVITVPSQSGSSFSQIGGTTPAGAAATGDGSLADIVNPPSPNPDPTVQLAVDLGDILQVIALPSVPGIPAL